MFTTTRDDSLSQIIEFTRPRIMAEFGSWEGASAIAFLLGAKKANLELEVICVDTWLGSPEHWKNSLPNSQWSFERLRVVGGEPKVIETFRKNIESHGFSPQVRIVRAPTTHAAGYISRTCPKLDLVFLDADHSFGAVRSDLKLAFDLIGSKGLVAGDDWGWSPVQLAVALRSIFRRGICVSPDGSTYVLLQRNQSEFGSKFDAAHWRRQAAAGVLIKNLARQTFRLLRKKAKLLLDSVYSLLLRSR